MSGSRTIFVSDPATDLEGFVVIDTVVAGRALGGTRMTSGVTAEEIAELARKMSLKLALAEIPIGGAKAGIVSRLAPGPARDRTLESFGRAAAPLLHDGIYLGSDLGVTHRDRDLMFRAAGYDVTRQPDVAVPCGWDHLWVLCQDIAGFGVAEATAAAVEALGIECRTVAVQGFGAVGRSVACYLAERNFGVVAVADRNGTVSRAGGLPLQQLVDATDARGNIDRSRLPSGLAIDPAPDAWLDVDADIMILAAVGDAVNDGNAARVRGSLVVEGGNCACSPAAQTALAARGVRVLPDIVVNSGSAAVTGLTLVGANPPHLETDQLVEWFYNEVSIRLRRNVISLLQRADEDRRPLYEIATELATDRLGILNAP